MVNLCNLNLPDIFRTLSETAWISPPLTKQKRLKTIPGNLEVLMTLIVKRILPLFVVKLCAKKTFDFHVFQCLTLISQLVQSEETEAQQVSAASVLVFLAL